MHADNALECIWKTIIIISKAAELIVTLSMLWLYLLIAQNEQKAQ